MEQVKTWKLKVAHVRNFFIYFAHVLMQKLTVANCVFACKTMRFMLRYSCKMLTYFFARNF